MSQTSDKTNVAYTDFDAKSDLPIGQLVRRYGENTLGIHTPGNSLTPLQARFADQLKREAPILDRARTMTSAPIDHGPGNIRLDNALSAVPTWVDTSFGRFAQTIGPSLIPHGHWTQQIDADLLSLWLEEEEGVQDQHSMGAWSPARSSARSSARRPAPRRQALPRVSPGPSSPNKRITAQARRVLRTQGKALHRAMVEAVRGDTQALARLTHGDVAAEMLAQGRASKVGGRDALDHQDLMRLSATVPTLAIDASRPDFSVEAAAIRVLKVARRAARRRVKDCLEGGETAPAAVGRIGSLATRATALSTRAALRSARLDLDRPSHARAVRRTALSLTPFESSSVITTGAELAPDLHGVLSGDRSPTTLGDVLSFGLDGFESTLPALQKGALMPSDEAPTPGLGSNIARGLPRSIGPSISRSERFARFGATAFKAIKVTPRGASMARRFLRSGPPGALVTSTETAQDSPAQFQLQPPTALRPGPVSSQELGALLGAHRALLDPARRPSSPLISEARPPAHIAYDAAASGDFAAVVARALANATKRGPSLRTIERDGSTGEKPLALQPRGVSSAAEGVVLDGVFIAQRYMPALTKSIAQITQSIDLLGRMVPMALGAANVEPGARTPIGVGEVLSRVTNRGATIGAQIETIASIIRAQRGSAHRPHRATLQRSRWGRELVSLTQEAALQTAASTLEETIAKARRAASLDTIAPQQQADDTELQLGSKDKPRALRLFSPEKTMALLAPMLESGGLLDPIGRTEMFMALAALTQQAARAPAERPSPRRVRTTFGTVLVKIEGGQLVIDSEEISSNAPGVRLKAGLSSLDGFQPDAPVRRPQIFERLPALEVHLGTEARSERIAKVKLDPILALTPETSGPQRRAPIAQVRDLSTGGLVKLYAESAQAARIVKAVREMGAVMSPPGSRTLQQAPRAQGQPEGKSFSPMTLDRALSTLFQRRSDLLRATSLHRALGRQPEPIGDLHHLALQAIAGPLSEAADARVIGALGKIAMARPAIGDLTRADLAQVLPYLQRDAQIARQVQALAAAKTDNEIARRGGALATAIGNVLEQGVASKANIDPFRNATSPIRWVSGDALVDQSLSMGRSRRWLSAVQRMRLESLEPKAPTSHGRAPEQQRSAGTRRPPQRATRALLLGSLLKHTREKKHAGPRIDGLVPKRRAAIEQTMSLHRAMGDLPQQPGIFRGKQIRPTTFGGAILREIKAVKEVLRPIEALPHAKPLVSLRTSPAAQTQPSPIRSASRPGRLGIWFPEGVQRMLETTTERILSHGDIEATFLAPSLFGAAAQPSPQSHQASGQNSARETDKHMPALQAGAFETMKRRMALNLRRHVRRTSNKTGSSLAVGAGGGHTGSDWTKRTSAQRGIARLMATLDLSTVNAQSDPEDKWIQPGAKGVPDRSGPAPRKTGLARNLIKREKRKESPAIESGRFQGADLPKRTLFTPPSVNIPAAGIAAAPADMAPRAAMGGSSVETSEGSDRKATAHQTGVPSQESIEDMAREVLTELKRRWSYELERRGIE